MLGGWRPMTASSKTGPQHLDAEAQGWIRSFFLQLPIVVWAFDTDGITTLSEGGMLNVFGLEPGQSIGMAIKDIYSGSPEIMRAHVQAAGGESTVTTVGFGPMTTEMHLVPYRDEDGDIIGGIGLAYDVSGRDNAWNALRRSEVTTLALLDAIPDEMMRIDRDGNVLTHKPGKQGSSLGISGQGVIGRNITDVLDSSLAASIKDAMSRSFDQQQLDAFEHKCKSAGTGAEQHLEVEVIPGGEDYVLVILRDITDRIQRQNEEQQTQRLESIGRLAAGIAHEINTPIQFVGDNLRFLNESLDQLLPLIDNLPTDAAEEAAYLRDELPKSLEDARDGVKRVAAIVGAMRSFAGTSSDMASADINRGLTDTITIAASEWRPVAEIETDFAELPPVFCNIGELNQVFLNLILNAAHAIGEKVEAGEPLGRIFIKTRAADKDVLIDVRDTGSGISADVLDRIFDPFFTTKAVGKGTGQGLSLSRAIIDRHGGQLDVQCESGAGTTFTVRLPVDPRA
jgi:PAS domain S-box-containing protein